MAFVPTHPVSTFRASAILDVARRAAVRLRDLHSLTPQQRANRYVSRMSVAVIAG